LVVVSCVVGQSDGLILLPYGGCNKMQSDGLFVLHNDDGDD
jgi:hypothetical protein